MISPPLRKFRDGLIGVVKSDLGDLTMRQTSIFLFVATARNSLSNRDVAEHIDLSGPVVSRAVTALEERGLVARRTDPDDRRLALLDVTRAGLEALSSLQNTVSLAYTGGAR